jgi:cystathionine beta-synthase
MLKVLGVEIHRTPTEATSSDPEGNIEVATRICKERSPDAFMPDQYNNPNNPLAHYWGTAEEIWKDCGGKIDVVVMGAGTGGTITGIAKRLKELDSKIVVVGVDPVGSILGGKDCNVEGGGGGGGGGKGSYQIEGIGYDFFPSVLERGLVDHWVKIEDRESFRMTRRLIHSEGLLCGGSSGSAMVGAIKAAKMLNLGADKRMVVILPDSIRNYMTKLLNDDWMLIHKFMDPNECEGWKEVNESSNGACACGSLKGILTIPVVDVNAKGSDLITLFKKNPNGPRIIAVKEAGEVIGSVNMDHFGAKLIRRGVGVLAQPVRRHMEKEFAIVHPNTPLPIGAIYTATGYPVFMETANDDSKMISLLEAHLFL